MRILISFPRKRLQFLTPPCDSLSHRSHDHGQCDLNNEIFNGIALFIRVNLC
jgi:hypothetical protein